MTAGDAHRSAEPPLASLLAERAWVRALARGLVACESDVDDVEQETWLAAMRRPPREETPPRAWLATVVRNQARLLLRRGGRRGRFETAGARPEATTPTVDLVAHADALRKLVAALLALPEPYRGTLLVRYFEGVSPTDIARRAGEPIGTVKTRLRRGLTLLRERLDEESGGDKRRALVLLLLAAPEGDESPPTATGGVSSATSMALLAGAAILVVAGFATWWRTDDVATRRDAGESSPATVAASRRATQATTTLTAVDATPSHIGPATTASTVAAPEPTRRLVGVVVDAETDRVLADAVVRLSNLRADGSEATFETCGRTDAEGRFAVDGVPDRRWKFEVVAPGHRPFLGEIGRGPLDAPAVVPLAAGRDLTVFVTGPNGAPLESARVEYASKWGNFTWTLRTDHDGAVARAGIECDVGTATVSSPGLAECERSIENGVGPVIERIQLTCTPTVAIAVGDATRVRFGPTAAWRFVVSPGWLRYSAHRLEATADANGVAELRGLPTGKPSAIVAFVSLGEESEAGPFDVASDVFPERQDRPIRWELAGARVVRVICDGDVAARGPAALRLSASCALGDEERRRLEADVARFQRGTSVTYPHALGFSARGRVGADGVACLVLPIGSVSIRAFASAPRRPIAERVFTVDASTQELTLPVPKRDPSIAGRVVGPDGSPMPHRAVQAWIHGKFDRWTETDASGRFEFESLPDGVYTVGARGVYDEIGGAVVTDVRVPTLELELRIGAVTVRGRVRGANGRRCSVSLFKEYDAPGYLAHTWTDAAGAFELRAFSPGRCIVDAWDGDRHAGRWNGEIPADASEFSFEIEPESAK